MTTGVSELMKGTSVYVIGSSITINWAVAKELATGLEYVVFSFHLLAVLSAIHMYLWNGNMRLFMYLRVVVFDLYESCIFLHDSETRGFTDMYHCRQSSQYRSSKAGHQFNVGLVLLASLDSLLQVSMAALNLKFFSQ